MQDNSSILSRIQSPRDLRTLSIQELKKLASEIRTTILKTTSQTGGHVSSNLGVVELTLALHRVFDTPVDSIIWDVGHQTYTHKLLTGRLSDFHTIRQKSGISGFPKITESEHDSFGTGHASTSISAAVGVNTGKKLLHQKGFSIAVIGDGALTGGLAFEGLSNANQYAKNTIVILNDNGFSINKNKSYFSKHLSKFTIKNKYLKFKSVFDSSLEKIPLVGEPFLTFIRKIKRAIKTFSFSSDFFIDFGFQYVGPIDGHNIEELETVFKTIKDLNSPVVVHVKTKKGFGYSYAEKDPSRFHGVGHFNIVDGKLEATAGKSFSHAFTESLCQLASTDTSIVAITAAMLDGTGLVTFNKQFPERCFDVGIAEEHAVTFAAGLARVGIKPCVAIYSTFLQRSIDQIIHDVALQNLPVVFAIDRAGAVANDGETHQGSFDICLLRPIPNMSILAPASETELSLCLQWAFNRNAPVAIRYPKATCPTEIPQFLQPLIEGRGVFLTNDDTRDNTSHRLLIVLCTGSLYPQVFEAKNILEKEQIIPSIYSLRFIKPLDKTYFLEICDEYTNILFVEEGAYIGGIACELEHLVLKNQPSKKTDILAFPDTFLKQGNRNEILATLRLSGEDIADACRMLYKAEMSN